MQQLKLLRSTRNPVSHSIFTAGVHSRQDRRQTATVSARGFVQTAAAVPECHARRGRIEESFSDLKVGEPDRVESAFPPCSECSSLIAAAAARTAKSGSVITSLRFPRMRAMRPRQVRQVRFSSPIV